MTSSIPSASRSRLRSLLPRLLLLAVSLAISLAVGEYVLRSKGHAPGFVPAYINKELRPVEELVVSNKYVTDADGVFKANPDGDFHKGIKINSEGFRSIEFENTDSDNPTILILGDSFAFGFSAQPITNCYADILTRYGYSVFNAGIPRSDPKQYAFLAEKWIPRLRPGVVAVTLCMNNDIQRYRPMVPFRGIAHVTNVGWLDSYDEFDRYMTEDEAYKRYIGIGNKATEILERNSSSSERYPEKLMLRSALGTNILVLIDGLLANDQTLESNDKIRKNNQDYAERRQRIKDETREYLLRIERAAIKADARFFLFLIPVRPSRVKPWNSIEDNMDVFDGFDPWIPGDLHESDYMKPPNIHFNNTGHQKFASLMLRALRAQPTAEPPDSTSRAVAAEQYPGSSECREKP